jgi:hypothetical protein
VSLFEAYFTLTWFLNAALLVVILFAFIDAAVRRGTAYVAAGKQTKQLWVLVLGVAFAATFLAGVISLFGMAALVASIVYLVDVRPAVRAVSGGGPRGSANGPYGPW